MLVFSTTIVVQNIKVLTFSSSFYVANVFFMALSIILFQLSFLIINFWVDNEYYGLFIRLWGNLNVWMVVLLVILSTYNADNVFTKFQRT